MRIVLAAMALCIASSPALCRIWHVPSDAPTIQAGVDSAQVGDEVVIACGTYTDCTHAVPRPDAGLACIILKSGITLRSETGHPECVIINAMQLGRVIDCCSDSGTLEDITIEGLTLTGGRVTITGPGDNGGALACRNASVLLKRCRIIGNYASGTGGGINAEWSDVEMQDCLITENTVPGSNHGGGFLINWDSHLILRNCSVISNHAGNGGGLYAVGAILDFYNVDFSGNTSNEGFPWNGNATLSCISNFYCCSIDGGWSGESYVFDEGCSVSNQQQSWGSIKLLYR